MGTPADRVFFVDDSERNVSAAAAAGIRAHRFVGVSDLEAALLAAGVR